MYERFKRRIPVVQVSRGTLVLLFGIHAIEVFNFALVAFSVLDVGWCIMPLFILLLVFEYYVMYVLLFFWRDGIRYFSF